MRCYGIVWLCVMVLAIRHGRCQEAEEPVPQQVLVSQMMADLRRVYDGKINNLHADFNKRFVEQEKRYTELESKYVSLNEAVNGKSHNSRLVHSGGNGETVGFYAQLSRDTANIENFQPIVYDLVTTNIGNVYNAENGIFTVPLTGPYVLSWTSANSHSHIQTELVVNSVVQRRTWADALDNESVAMTSNTVVLVLKAGDTVWIRPNTEHSAPISGGQLSSFSGWLLKL